MILRHQTSQVIKDLYVTAGARLGIIVLGIALQAILAWTLKPEGRGAFAACQIFAIALMSFSGFGVYRGIAYHTATGALSRQEAFSSVLLSWFLLSFFGLAIGLCVILLPIDFFNKASYSSFAWGISWALCLHLFVSISSYLTSIRRFALRSTILLTEALFNVILVYAFISQLGKSPEFALAGCVSSLIFVSLGVLFYLAYCLDFKIVLPSQNQLKSIASYGSRSWVGELTQTAESYASLIIVAIFLPNKDLGYLAVAMAFFNQAKGGVDVFRTVMDPRVAEAEDGCRDTIAFIARNLFALSLIGSLVFILIGRQLIALLFSPEFLPALTIIYILLPAFVFEFTTRIIYSYFNGINRPEIVSVLTSIRLCLMVLSLLVVVPNYGLVGTAAVVTLTTFIHSLGLAFCFWKYSKLSPFKLFIPNYSDISQLKSYFSNTGRRAAMRLTYQRTES